ncbi:hypothetical protein BHM03_00037235, partial [Ensete ventricosum]
AISRKLGGSGGAHPPHNPAPDSSTIATTQKVRRRRSTLIPNTIHHPIADCRTHPIHSSPDRASHNRISVKKSASIAHTAAAVERGWRETRRKRRWRWWRSELRRQRRPVLALPYPNHNSRSHNIISPSCFTQGNLFLCFLVLRPPRSPSSPSSPRPSPAKPRPSPYPRKTSSPPSPRFHTTPPSPFFSIFIDHCPKPFLFLHLSKAEDTIAQVVDVGSSVWGFSLDVFRSLSETLKPGVDAALPILQSASKEALKIASPVVSDASKQAKEALQSAGVDPSPVLSAAQVVSLFSSSSLHSRLNVLEAHNTIQMCSYSDIAKIVARTLTSLGFKNCWIVMDGFSGGKGWLQSRLGTDSYSASLVEVLSPSRVIPAATARFGTTSSTALQSTRKLLPGSIEK